jgi:hypothetical protein
MALKTSKFLVWPCVRISVTYTTLPSLLLKTIVKNVGHPCQTNLKVTKMPLWLNKPEARPKAVVSSTERFSSSPRTRDRALLGDGRGAWPGRARGDARGRGRGVRPPGQSRSRLAAGSRPGARSLQHVDAGRDADLRVGRAACGIKPRHGMESGGGSASELQGGLQGARLNAKPWLGVILLVQQASR